MDRNTAEHAFEPHFRSRAVQDVPGHGLGLAIVKRTVEALGGSCALASTPERGTRVAIKLPSATP
jgi:signal transduction histidine kinase